MKPTNNTPPKETNAKTTNVEGLDAAACSRLIPTPTLEEMENIDAAAYQEYRKMQRGAKGQTVTFVGSIGFCTIMETLNWVNKTMGGPQGSRETSVDDDRARPPSYHGHTRCQKCGEIHWMHVECISSAND